MGFLCKIALFLLTPESKIKRIQSAKKRIEFINIHSQVQASVKDIIGRSIAQPNLKTDLIIYADNAHVIDFTAANYETVINNQRAGGMTNFKAAFTKVNRIVSEAGKFSKQLFYRF